MMCKRQRLNSPPTLVSFLTPVKREQSGHVEQQRWTDSTPPKDTAKDQQQQLTTSEHDDMLDFFDLRELPTEAESVMPPTAANAPSDSPAPTHTVVKAEVNTPDTTASPEPVVAVKAPVFAKVATDAVSVTSPAPDRAHNVCKRPQTFSFTNMDTLSTTCSSDIASIKHNAGDLVYTDNFMSSAEQRNILSLLDQLPWQRADTYIIERRMQLYGEFGRDSYSKGKLCLPFPTFFKPIVEKLIEYGVYSADDAPVAAVAQEYLDRQGLGFHVDKPSYGDVIADISLVAPCVMRLEEVDMPAELSSITELAEWHQNNAKYGNHCPRTGRKYQCTLKARSLLVMRGTSRWRWVHGIPKLKDGRSAVYRRVSLTFRTLRDLKTPLSRVPFTDCSSQLQSTRGELRLLQKEQQTDIRSKLLQT